MTKVWKQRNVSLNSVVNTFNLPMEITYYTVLREVIIRSRVLLPEFWIFLARRKPIFVMRHLRAKLNNVRKKYFYNPNPNIETIENEWSIRFNSTFLSRRFIPTYRDMKSSCTRSISINHCTQDMILKSLWKRNRELFYIPQIYGERPGRRIEINEDSGVLPEGPDPSTGFTFYSNYWD